jgi:hypothetical protein
VTSRRQVRTRFRVASRQQALRRKEFVLLRRDPWLVSQTLMQLLYLLPPALMLWRSFADRADAAVLATPVLVMAAGQLAGGLAWLTISGEDAADLVATAPLPASRVIRAKIEVVLMVIAAVFAPLLVPLAWVAPLQVVVATLGIAVATISATAIQLWFRVTAPPQPVPPSSDRIAAGDLRGSLLVDWVGGDRSDGVIDAGHRGRHGPADIGGGHCNVVVQSGERMSPRRTGCFLSRSNRATCGGAAGVSSAHRA